MDFHIRTAMPDMQSLEQVARLWNNNAAGRHAFFPWTAELLRRLLTDERGAPVGHLLLAVDAKDEAVGFLHYNQVIEDGYPWAGVIEAVLVDAPWRGHGVGTALLDAALRDMDTFRLRPDFVDALGAWPFGYAFNALADGSERSGVFLSEPAVYRLFRRAGFEPVRKSIVMRSVLSEAAFRETPDNCGYHIEKRSERTWLDRVFRGRELWDHDLCRFQDGRVLSRCIFGFMENESRHEKQAVFSVFGVNTPADMQRKGYAGVNISHLMRHLIQMGGEVLELHVYADNTPALALYTSLGFKPIAETAMMHKRL